ncbi:DEKNAAC101403, partial [Brettanomyces naardenensis]
MAITELGSKRARTFSMLDDFEAGNTGLDDIIDIPMDIRGQTKKSCSTGFDFNDYLVRFALNGSIGDSNEVYSQEPRLDFSRVTKSIVGEEEVAIDAGNGDDDDDDDEELDMQVRSNHFDNYSDSREVV